MALTVAVEVLPAMWAVRLTATGYTGTVDWYRSGGATDLHLGTGPILTDRAIPLNEPVIYYATDDTDLTVADAVQIDTPNPILANTTSSNALQVVAVSYRPYQGQGASVWHPVLGRPDPYVTIHPATYPAGELVLRVADNAQRIELIRMLQPGDPLLLRSTCPERLDTFTFLMTSWSDPFTQDQAKEGPAYLRIQYQRVTEVQPAWQPPPDRTYQTVLNENATYQAVLDGHGTYQALLDGLP